MVIVSYFKTQRGLEPAAKRKQRKRREILFASMCVCVFAGDCGQYECPSGKILALHAHHMKLISVNEQREAG